MNDITIIGAGPAGMMAAITAARRGAGIVLLEQNTDIGKKLLSTGNGKCNYTNKKMDSSCFNGSIRLIKNGLSVFNENDTIAFFEELGIPAYDKNGYIYPNSKQAASVVAALRMEMMSLKIDVRTSFKVTDIKKTDKGYVVFSETDKVESKKLIIAAGLKAAPKLGSDGSMFKIIESLGHRFLPVVPALCGFYCEGLKFNKTAGVRCDCALTLHTSAGNVLCSEGELQITDYGMSGIPVFQISRYASMDIKNGNTPRLETDFMPRMSDDELLKYLRKRVACVKDKRSVNEMLNGILNQKLMLELIHQSKISPDKKAAMLDDKDLNKLVSVMKHTYVYMKKPRSFEFAQICAGGIDTKQIDPCTLSSKVCDNLYFAGEILDVDGICGGYNLQWAWTSGYIAGMESSK